LVELVPRASGVEEAAKLQPERMGGLRLRRVAPAAAGLLLAAAAVGALLVAPPPGPRARPRPDTPALPGSLCAAAQGRRGARGQSRGAIPQDGALLEALRVLRNGGDGGGAAADSVQLPGPLSAPQRAMLHASSARVGLGHEACGHGSARGVRVWRKDVSARLAELAGALAAEERAALAEGAADVADADRYVAFVGRMQQGLELCRRHAAARPGGAVARLLDALLGTGGAAGGAGRTVGAGVGGGDGGCAEGEKKWLDRCLSQEQRQAVVLCMGEGEWPPPQAAVVTGAAGTGKSRAILELVRRRLRLGQRVLVCLSRAHVCLSAGAGVHRHARNSLVR
jgi:hypothetical protein